MNGPANMVYPKNTLELLKYIIKRLPGQLVKHLPSTIFIGAVTMALHTFLLVYVNEGFSPDTWLGRNILNTKGYFISSTLLWAMFGSIISLMFFSGKNGGNPFSAAAGIFKMPGEIGKRNKLTNGEFLPYIYFSCAVTLFIEGLLSGAASAAAGFILTGSVMAFITGRGGILVQVLRIIVNDIKGFVFRKKAFGLNNDSITMLFGTSAMVLLIYGILNLLVLPAFITFILNYLWIVFTILGVIALKNKGPKHLMFIIAFITSAVLLYKLNWITALADDGGWSEAGGTFGSWINSPGAAAAVVRGLWPTLGGIIGFYTPSVAGGLFSSLPGTAGALEAGGAGKSSWTPEVGGVGEPMGRLETGGAGKSSWTPEVGGVGEPMGPLETGGAGKSSWTPEVGGVGEPMGPLETGGAGKSNWTPEVGGVGETGKAEIPEVEIPEEGEEEVSEKPEMPTTKEIRKKNEEHQEYIQKLCEKYNTTPDQLRGVIQSKMEQSTEQSGVWNKIANHFNILEKYAAALVTVSDVCVDGMANCTGIAGKVVRGTYKMTKNVASTMAEKGLTKEAFAGGVIAGVTDNATDFIENAKIKAAVTVTGKTLSTMAADGADKWKEGALKGTYDATVGLAVDKLAGKGYGSNVIGARKDLASGTELSRLSVEPFNSGANKFIQTITTKRGTGTYDVTSLALGKAQRQGVQSLIKLGPLVVNETVAKPYVEDNVIKPLTGE